MELPEIPRARLTFGRFGHVEDEGGEFYRVCRGQLDDPRYSSAVAFYLDVAGVPVYLERPTGAPHNRDEQAQAAAAREQRRADREAESRQRLARMKAATR